MSSSRISTSTKRRRAYLLALKAVIVSRYTIDRAAETFGALLMGMRNAIAKAGRAVQHAFDVVFHWKHPGVLIAFFVAVALGMFTLGQGAHSRFLVHLGFGVAYFSLLMAAIWAVGAWLKSGHWEKSHPGEYSRDKANIKSYRRSQWVGSIGIVFIFVVFVWITALYHLDKLSSLPNVNSATENPTEPLSILVKPVMFTYIRRQSNLAITYGSFHGLTISPVDMMLGVKIINTGSKPINIIRMQVEIPDVPGFGRSKWQTLTTLPLSSSKLYIGNDVTKLKPLTVPDLYGALSIPLEPEKPINGMAIFEYPDSFAGSDFSAFRFVVTDGNGKEHAIVIGGPIPASGEVDEMVIGAINKPEDLSNAYRKLYTER